MVVSGMEKRDWKGPERQASACDYPKAKNAM